MGCGDEHVVSDGSRQLSGSTLNTVSHVEMPHFDTAPRSKRTKTLEVSGSQGAVG